MITCNELVNALNETYHGTYVEFEKQVIIFIEKYMKSLNHDPVYIPSCLIKTKASYAGLVRGSDKIFINKRIITGLMKGNKLYLLVLFHELSHIKQQIQIQQGISTPNIIRYIKDILLDEYQTIENNKFFGETNHYQRYYYLNYEVDSMEIDANLDAILLTKEFFYENNIDFSKEEEKLNDYYHKFITTKNKKRNLTHCCTFNSYYLTLDDAFDVAIQYHPEWLDRYPQLKVEYHLVNGKIEKIKNPIYQKYAEINSEYHKYKKRIKKKEQSVC